MCSQREREMAMTIPLVYISITMSSHDTKSAPEVIGHLFIAPGEVKVKHVNLIMLRTEPARTTQTRAALRDAALALVLFKDA